MICVLRRVIVIGMLTSLSAPARVHGDPAPAADKKQLARQYVEAGLAAQRAGDYDTAVTLYQKAYQLVQHPVLIFNIAQAHRLAGRLKEALTLYKRYVAEAPQGDEASTAREFIAELEAQLARPARNPPAASAGAPAAPATSAARPQASAVRPAEPSTTSAARPAPPATSAARSAPAATPPAPRVAPPPAASLRVATASRPPERGEPAPAAAPGALPRPDPASSSIEHREEAADGAPAWRSQLPLIVGSGGALVLVAAGGVYLWSRSTYDSAKNELVQDRRDSLENSANTKRHVALGMAGAGLVCGGVAAWLYVRQRGEEHAAGSAASTHVVPLLGGATAGLAVLGGF